MTSGSNSDKYPTNLEGITIENKEEIQKEVKGAEEEETQRNKKLKVKSRYTGARLKGTRWVSEIKIPKGKSLWLGTFDKQEQAARAYDAASICLKGFQALPNLNFPPDLTPDRSSSDGLDTGKITDVDYIHKIANLAAHSGTFPSSSSTNDPAISSCLPPSSSMVHSVEQIDALATHSGTPSLPSSSNNPATTLPSCMSPSPYPSLENLVEQESANVVWDDQDFGEDGDIKLWSSP